MCTPSLLFILTCYPHSQVDVIISEWMVSAPLTFSFTVLKNMNSPSLETTHSCDWAQVITTMCHKTVFQLEPLAYGDVVSEIKSIFVI